ncbi:short chain dehydrogenase/reductase [Lophiostoma macrostomum CBS 122681]|uniref:Short chain dehydrogenase/reductase n=1 Tax=Lophiostoma macrostomum CBS 122681 TaxID=1314788 RepID=A0A6A6TAR4_9PLEO|nr:short chain dehydrogenase/reductase [Lophiostoma macrostomum CBS 122681]
MPYELKGRNVLVTGGSAGLGEVICYTFAKQGCNVAVNYFNRFDPAEKVRKECESHGVKAVLVKADMCDTKDVKRSVEEATEKLGGLDIIIGNAGWTKFTEFGDLDAMSEEEWDRCWSANVKAPLTLLKAAKETFNANPEGGVFITTNSIAGNSQGGSSMPYAVTKAAQIQLIKCLAATQGPKIRVNTVLPGFLDTEWGRKYPQSTIDAVKDKAVLKHETYLQDCADAFVAIARNTSMTGQKMQIDAGLNVQGV